MPMYEGLNALTRHVHCIRSNNAQLIDPPAATLVRAKARRESNVDIRSSLNSTVQTACDLEDGELRIACRHPAAPVEIRWRPGSSGERAVALSLWTPAHPSAT